MYWWLIIGNHLTFPLEPLLFPKLIISWNSMEIVEHDEYVDFVEW